MYFKIPPPDFYVRIVSAHVYFIIYIYITYKIYFNFFKICAHKAL